MTFEVGERVSRRGLSGELVEGCVVDSVLAGGQQMLVVLVDREDGRSSEVPREIAGLSRAWTRTPEA